MNPLAVELCLKGNVPWRSGFVSKRIVQRIDQCSNFPKDDLTAPFPVLASCPGSKALNVNMEGRKLFPFFHSVSFWCVCFCHVPADFEPEVLLELFHRRMNSHLLDSIARNVRSLNRKSSCIMDHFWRSTRHVKRPSQT